MSTVTIVVPIYNVYNYLERNLESLRNQTYKDIRILCINDYSEDKSQEIVNKYVEIDDRFSSYIKPNGGLSDSRNYGLNKVETKYVMFIDSDDFVEKTMVEDCLNMIQEHNLDMVCFAYNQYYVESNKYEFISNSIKDGIYNLKDNPEILAYTSNSAWSKMYKTSLFKENNIEYPFGYRHQDLGTTAKLLYKANKIGYINKPLYNYLVDRPNNITSLIDNKAYHILDMLIEICDYYKEQKVFDLYHDELKYLSEININQSLRKIVKLKDKKFVYKMIDQIFDFKEEYFKTSNKYVIEISSKDKVYYDRKLCKAYYMYKRMGF